MEHEKNIVTKLKGGCSYFIPKYYRMEAAIDPPDTLFMEYLQGEELDFFVLARNETISLWTKVCLLLNLVHGLRYLSNYEIVHLDVKPINVLVCRQLITKIIDYGEAYHKDICSPSTIPSTQTTFQATPSPTSPPKFTTASNKTLRNDRLLNTQKSRMFLPWDSFWLSCSSTIRSTTFPTTSLGRCIPRETRSSGSFSTVSV